MGEQDVTEFRAGACRAVLQLRLSLCCRLPGDALPHSSECLHGHAAASGLTGIYSLLEASLGALAQIETPPPG